MKTFLQDIEKNQRNEKQNMKNMKIGSKIIGDDKPAYIIAEIGGNFSTFEHGKKLINSAISIGIGGVAVSLAKMSIASQMGLKVNLSNIQKTSINIKNTHILFSESQSRIITTVSSSNRKKFETCFELQMRILSKYQQFVHQNVMSFY